MEFTTLHQIKRYITKQELITNHSHNDLQTQKTKIDLLLILWRDYLQLAGKLNRNTTKKYTLFPKNLKDEHDVVSALVKVAMNKEMDKAIRKLYQPLYRQYYFEMDAFLIRPPKNFKEFILKVMSCGIVSVPMLIIKSMLRDPV